MLIPVDTLVAFAIAFAFALAVPFALCADVIPEHDAENEVLLRREQVQRASDDEPDGLQTLAPSEVHVQVLLSCGLQQIWNTLTLQSLYGQFTIPLVTGE